MASSRRWSRADGDESAAVVDAVRRSLASYVPRGATIVVGLSGGRDSVALLDATLACASDADLGVAAVHVHHALSRHADDWSRFCAELCRERNVRFEERRVDVPRLSRTSLEASARRARYAALADAVASTGARALLLAHHQNDQAETVLLQLLRGAGPQGLAAMPHARIDEAGWMWLRPLLDVPRAAIDAYVRARGLHFVDDDSNVDPRYARNALRANVVPALVAVAPGYPETVARAALHQAEAALLADDLAAHDAQEAFDGATFSRGKLADLPRHRARNVLRWFLRRRGLPAPSSARLAAIVQQLCNARHDARVCIAHADAQIGLHRDRIVVHRPPPPPFERRWNGEATVELSHGTLEFRRHRSNESDAAALLLRAEVVIRSRRGGERIQLAANRPRQTLKSLLQRADLPLWTRRGLPLVFCGDALACVPGIGVDRRFVAPAGEIGYEIVWTER